MPGRSTVRSSGTAGPAEGGSHRSAARAVDDAGHGHQGSATVTSSKPSARSTTQASAASPGASALTTVSP